MSIFLCLHSLDECHALPSVGPVSLAMIYVGYGRTLEWLLSFDQERPKEVEESGAPQG
jgi:hypothetical protein